MIFFYLLVTVMPMIKHPLWAEFVGDLTVMKYLGIICVAYALFYLPMRAGAPGYLATWQSRFFLAWIVVGSIFYLRFGTADLSFEVSPFMSYASFLAFFFVTLTVVDSLHRLRWTLLMAIASVGWASLHVIREWQKYGGMAAGYRPGFLTGDPNYYSLSAVLCLPLAYYLIQTRPTLWERRFCQAVLAVTVLGLTLAASRGGFLGMVVVVVMIALRAKHRTKMLVIVALVIVPLLAIAPSSPLSRILSPNEHDIYSADHRRDLATAGLQMFWAYPMTGVGPGNFKAALAYFSNLPELHIAHNTYVSVMAEMGLPGIVLFLGAIAAAFISLERVRRASRKAGVVLLTATADGLQIGLAGFIVAAFFVSAEVHRLFWMALFISMTLPSLLERAEPDAAPAPPSAVVHQPRMVTR
jgi:O-antigen ligase